MIYFNSHEVLFSKFPNGETMMDFTIPRDSKKYLNWVTLKYEDDTDLIKLLFVKKYLDEHRITAHLKILYMPYSRMDRSENNSPFTLKYVSQFVNSLDFNRVIVLEPHSDVTPALLNFCESQFPVLSLLDIAINRYRFNKEKDYVFFPDAGAAKRYGKCYEGRTLIGHKERDFQTGLIKEFKVLGSVDNDDFKVIIVDDLCSRGGTFIQSAIKLKELGANEIYLVVTHCENTIFDGEIPKSDLINEVLTTDTILSESKNEKVHIIKNSFTFQDQKRREN